MKIVILAGGVGQRLWPLSRTKNPKQITPVIGSQTLLQQTVSRLLKKFRPEDLFIVTGKDFAKNIAHQVPRFDKKHILVEPARKNTAAAIGLAAYKIAKKNPKEVLITIASDHFIDPAETFLKRLEDMNTVVKNNPRAVCMMGLKPTYPETGYGYIKIKKQSKKFHGAFPIDRYVEKPSLALAKKYVRSGEYYWNPSYFAWQAGRIQELFSKYIPKTHELLKKTVAGDKGAFRKIDPESVDYAVLEKITSDFYVVPANFSWADIGHWATIREIQAKTSDSNVTLGTHHTIDTSGSLLYNYTDSVLTTIGVKDLIIVQTPDGTLVCRKDRAQDVKKLVEMMAREKKLKRFL